jgi:ubiquinone/menaquinone biosynthesis C-methylase UbiE
VAVLSVPERLLWAVETLAVDPAERLLEIGCGRGVAVSLVCERLVSGKITAIDRSAKMTEPAAQRNREHISAGKAEFRTAELRDAGLDGERFDKIFAVNLNLFWVRSPAKELDLIKRLLKPGGAVYLCYEPPGATQAAGLADTLNVALASSGFATMTHLKTTATKSALLGVVGRPEPTRRSLR